VQRVRGKTLPTGDLHQWTQHNNVRLQARVEERHIKKVQGTNGIPTKHEKPDVKAAWQEEKIYDRVV
jgi:hypothetical protein